MTKTRKTENSESNITGFLFPKSLSKFHIEVTDRRLIAQ